MSATKNQFERRDRLLQLLEKRHTKKELLKELNAYMLQNFGESVSLRTLEYDLNYLYKKLDDGLHMYTRSEPYYVLTQSIRRKILFDDEERQTLHRALQILMGIQNGALAGRLKGVLDKASLGLLAEEAVPRVAFENHSLAEGTQHLDDLLEAVNQEQAVHITYTGFSDKRKQAFVFSPYFLKEYRSRWYAMGLNHSTGTVYNLGLDRINALRNTAEAFVPNTSFDPAEYFKCLIGVTRPEDAAPLDIELLVRSTSAPYVRSKKIIANQELCEEYPNGDIRVRLRAFNNYELRQNLLGFGEALIVLKPQSLARQMRDILRLALQGYAGK